MHTDHFIDETSQARHQSANRSLVRKGIGLHSEEVRSVHTRLAKAKLRGFQIGHFREQPMPITERPRNSSEDHRSHRSRSRRITAY